ncbi:hypothetical protein [Methylobacter sp.]|uniref:hypothetical protein n=1 Tax=Methylobacter sp. TaxID=2051955 RepID=UPI002FDC7F06
MFSLGYILICVLIACLGIRRKFGFWGYFFASLLLTPLMGIILIAASDTKARNT